MIVSVSPIGLLLWAVLFYYLQTAELLALVMAICLHELGHIFVLMAVGAGITKLTINGAGLCIDYRHNLGDTEEFFAAIAGPAFGIVWYFIAARLGFELSAYLSLLLSFYNLLPFSVLDGGRAVGALLRNRKNSGAIIAKIDRVLCLVMAILGFYCVFVGVGVAILISSLWLIIYTLVKPTVIV